MKKDLTEVDNHKKKMIEEIKSLDKSEMFKPPVQKPKSGLFKRVLMIFGYGKKG